MWSFNIRLPLSTSIVLVDRYYYLRWTPYGCAVINTVYFSQNSYRCLCLAVVTSSRYLDHNPVICFRWHYQAGLLTPRSHRWLSDVFHRWLSMAYSPLHKMLNTFHCQTISMKLSVQISRRKNLKYCKTCILVDFHTVALDTL